MIQTDEEDLLINGKPEEEQKQGFFEKYFGKNSGAVLLFIYVVLCVIFGAANRVSFKLMQYPLINYGYFISQFTTFIYLPVNFVVILLKLLFTDDISEQSLAFPKWKFAVMGFLDSMQGLLIVVGGLQVPGIMQNLLLQGAVPVTMIFSLLLLRPTGDDISRIARMILEKKNIKFSEKYQEKSDEMQSVCKIYLNGNEIKNVPKLLANEVPPDPDVLARIIDWVTQKFEKKTEDDLSSVTLFSGLDKDLLEHGQVELITDSPPWSVHLKSFYSFSQYLGAAIVLAGLVVSVWPAVTTGSGSAGPILWDLIFFTATIPTALSGVYKEIGFRSVDDMDVWYLNGWVCVFQFLFGLLYAPVAAVMSIPPIPMDQIIPQIWQGFQCFLLGTNFITRANGFDCSEDVTCGLPGQLGCCDSCDGSLPGVSSISALVSLCIYMLANIGYNVLLVLVIKHGSAALMYITSTIVLPLGTICFTFRFLLGEHAQTFDWYNGSGLAVVMFGLFVYRFVDVFVAKIKSWNKA